MWLENLPKKQFARLVCVMKASIIIITIVHTYG